MNITPIDKIADRTVVQLLDSIFNKVGVPKKVSEINANQLVSIVKSGILQALREREKFMWHIGNCPRQPWTATEFDKCVCGFDEVQKELKQ